MHFRKENPYRHPKGKPQPCSIETGSADPPEAIQNCPLNRNRAEASKRLQGMSTTRRKA
jgi:hypothetical protein